jgi:hypothetical protein
VSQHEWPIFVISSGARDLGFSAICEEKISRLGLEMTIAGQVSLQKKEHSMTSKKLLLSFLCVVVALALTDELAIAQA